MDKIELRNEAGKIYAVITNGKEPPWIYLQWVGSIDGETLKQGVIELNKFVHKTKCPYVLSDRRIAKGNWFEINNWLEHKWAPMATQAGLQYMAHVRAPLAISQLSSQDFESRLLGFRFKSFDSLESAENWLRDIIRQSPESHL